MKRGLILVLILLGGCQRVDWRAQAIAKAEAQIRVEVSDPKARFSHVQLTGDSATGQTCGVVTARAGPEAPEKSGRFIVYIDATAGPFIEAGMGNSFLSQEDFDRAWQGDCVREGYRA